MPNTKYIIILLILSILIHISCENKELDIAGEMGKIDKDLPLRSRDDILSVLYDNYDALQDIYQEALQSPEGYFATKIILEFTIHPDGSVTDISTLESNCKRPDFEEQLINYIGNMDFGAMPNSPTPVEYPFVFAP